MNSKIKQIERKCWNNQSNTLDSEKFAAEILQECANTISKHSAEFTNGALSAKLLNDQILKNFEMD